MHPNPIFHSATARANLDWAAHRGFGTLALSAEDGPLLAHVPFILTEGGALAELHLVRSNPLARALEAARPVVLAVTGPDSYVSPDWYETPDQVPTWNYVAVHLRGTLERRPDSELRDLLDRQSAQYEARLAPKPPWTTAKMDPDALARLMRAIVPCRMRIAAVDGTWKLSQNKPDPVRLRAAAGIDGHRFGSDTAELAALMQQVPPTP